MLPIDLQGYSTKQPWETLIGHLWLSICLNSDLRTVARSDIHACSFSTMGLRSRPSSGTHFIAGALGRWFNSFYTAYSLGRESYGMNSNHSNSYIFSIVLIKILIMFFLAIIIIFLKTVYSLPSNLFLTIPKCFSKIF